MLHTGALGALILAVCSYTATAASEWRSGRGTFYGNEPWLWSIHEGSCGYGYIFPDEPLGWDVAAMSDANSDFAGSCGRCYEVKCVDKQFNDGFGNGIDRSASCYDGEASLVVRTTDTCPCNYNGNAYSNKRWCCGDMDHFDLSIWAFEKLADTKWGVMALEYRAVPCDYQPAKQAPDVSNPFPGEQPPAGATRTDRWGTSSADASGLTFEEQQAEAAAAGTSTVVTKGGIGAGWSPAHYYADVFDVSGRGGHTAVCGKLKSGGALAWQTSPGAFDGKISAEVWARCAEGVPDIDVNLSGGGSYCKSVRLQDMSKSGESEGWCRYDVYLGLFDAGQADQVVAFAESFKGCGGKAAAELDRVEFKNNKGHEQNMCVDELTLLGS